jgi:RND family efflux transporter MFP subunit
MNARRLIVPLVNIIFFGAAGIALYKIGNNTILPEANAPDEDAPKVTSVPVNVATVTRQTLRRMVTAYGRIEPAPAGKDRSAGAAHVGAPFAGIVGEVNCVEGQRVKVGETLFQMDARSAQADVRRAQAVLTASQAALEKSENAAKQNELPRWIALVAQWEKETAQANLDRAVAERQLLTVAAPISGIVATIRMGPGETASAGAVVIELIDPDRVVLALDVPGFLVGDAKVGQTVLIEAADRGDTTRPAPTTAADTRAVPIESRVLVVDPSIDPATGLASVDASIGGNLALRTGQFLRARIVVEQRPDCLTVPAESVVSQADGHPAIAVVSNDEHSAVLQPVDLGLREGDRVEVRADWLEVGTTIVTTGASALLDRSDIRVVGR